MSNVTTDNYKLFYNISIKLLILLFFINSHLDLPLTLLFQLSITIHHVSNLWKLIFVKYFIVLTFSVQYIFWTKSVPWFLAKKIHKNNSFPLIWNITIFHHHILPIYTATTLFFKNHLARPSWFLFFPFH